MVTIEQKLSMFSKLLHRSMNDKFSEEMEMLKKEYEDKVQKNREAVDKEAAGLLNNWHKKAEAEKTELASRIKVSMKREYMSAKEKHFAALMDRLKEEIRQFIRSGKYGEYLSALAKKAAESEQFSQSLVIYLTAGDHERFGGHIRQELLKAQQTDLSFKIADDSIIGGFIIEDDLRNLRMDFSINALLEDNRAYIMQTLFQAIEAGETNGTYGI